MQRNLLLAITLILCFMAGDLYGQDPRFSQYYNSPWNLNPAMTGLHNGRWRATVNYRDQWSSILENESFNTYALAGDFRFNVSNTDYAAFGLGVMHDEAGTSQYEQNKVEIGGAFLKQLSGGRRQADHYLSVGAQLGAGQQTINWNQLWFSRQYDPVAQRPDLGAGNGENMNSNSSNVYIDFNAGLLWYALLENDGFFYLGGAMHHINSPDISVMEGGSESLYSRWSAHIGGQFPLSREFALLPGALVMRQGPSFETDFGLNIRYHNNDLNELGLRFGVWGRLGNRPNSGIQADAITFVGMLELERYVLGLSYDVTVSGLSQANYSRGAFEISFSYFHPGERRARVICPDF